MARPYNHNKNQYIVFLKSKGVKNPCKSALNTNNCEFITVQAITAAEAFAKAVAISRENRYLVDNELAPCHTRVDKEICRLNDGNCKDKYL